MDWSAMGDTGSHTISFESFSPEAQDCIRTKFEDELSCYSLRVAAKCRLIGKVDGSRLHIVWYDPEHQFCPSALKNT